MVNGIVGQLWHAWRWAAYYLRRLNKQLSPIQRRVLAGALAILIFLGVAIPLLNIYSTDRLYALSQASKTMLGTVNPTLAQKLTYDSASNAYYLNKNGIGEASSVSGNNPQAVAQSLEQQRIGDSESKAALKDMLYSAKLSVDPTQGITYYDDNLNLSFGMSPELKLMPARDEQGRVVYPYGNDAQLVYTPKGNGIEEDLIVKHSMGNELDLLYHLNLPGTLQARMLDDGSGGVGIYSADPALFGNITYGTQTDEAKIESARLTAQKDNLVFAIPAPHLVAADGQASQVSAHYVLSTDGHYLTMVVSNLNSQTYPLIVDPSVVVTSTSDFQSGMGNSDDIDFSTSGQIDRAGLTGGGTGSWGTTMSFTTARDPYSATVAYGGYLYILGGHTGGTGNTGNIVGTTQYASINSGGAIGSWTSTSSVPVTSGSSFIVEAVAGAYDGYMYYYGWGTAARDVYYAPINSNGSLGSWSTTTAMPSGYDSSTLNYTGAVANGYLYIEGGAVSNAISTVYYAPINANGTIGSWATTSSLYQAAYGTQSMAYNGYLYFMGVANNGSTQLYQYAPINSNGTLGTWILTNVPGYAPGAESSNSLIYDGYAYTFAGTPNGTTPESNVYYAPVNANGSLGNWIATNSLGTATMYAGAAAYAGYLYVLGGWGGSSNLSSVQYASINPAGSIASFNSTTSYGTATNNSASVAYNGYLYVLGGNTTGSTCTNSVQYAKVNSDGTLGTWGTTTAFTTNREGLGAVAYGGFMYIMGGYNCSSGNLNDVQYASINPTNGTVGTWTSSSSFTNVRTGLASAAYNGYLYILGGADTGYDNDVQYAPINMTSGAVGTWNTTTSFTTGRLYFAAQAVAGYMYILGGKSGSSTYQNDVQYAPINSNGTVGTWNTTSSFTTARAGLAAAVSNGFIYIMGGTNGGNFNDVQYAPINSNGTVGTWNTTSSFTTPCAYLTSVAVNGVLYAMGGSNGSSQNTVQYAQIGNGGPGSTSTWSTTSSFTTARSGQASVTYNGYLYVLGGINSSGTYLNDVQYAPINSNGTVGTWTATNSFTTARDYLTSVAYNGYLYILGGWNGGSNSFNDVQYAPINSNGTVGTWNTTSSFTTSRMSQASIVYNGYVYVIGGENVVSGTGTDVSSVEYAPINSNGTVGTWNTTSSFTTTRSELAATTYNGYVYLSGGYDHNSGGGGLYDVQYAPINSNGTLGTWTATTSLPAGNDGGSFLLSYRWGHTMLAYDGFVYVIAGGFNIGGNYNDVEYAPIKSNGTIGQWSYGGSITNYRTYLSGVAYNGYLYILGGTNNSGSTYNDVQYAPVNAIPRIAHYSKFITLGPNSQLASISYNGSLSAGVNSISYQLAGSNGVFGASQLANALPGGTSDCDSATTSGYNYMELTINLDDSQSAVFPDSASSNSYVTDVTVNYSGQHPAPSVRLRNGEYFATDTGTLQPLDTCH